MAEAQSSILIVDDDAEDLVSVERALRSLGTEIVSIKDPHDVLPGVGRLRPDVVILDALLPGLSGFDLCKQIKSDPQLKGTQVLILTGVYLRQQYRHEALQQFKADAFLTKPFRPPELQRLVVQLLARKMRMPPSSLLKRIGLPAASERKKRGLLGRLFGRTEAEEGASLRIAPVAREGAPAQPAPAGPPVDAKAADPASARETVLEVKQDEAPPNAAVPSHLEAEAKPDAEARDPVVSTPAAPHLEAQSQAAAAKLEVEEVRPPNEAPPAETEPATVAFEPPPPAAPSVEAEEAKPPIAPSAPEPLPAPEAAAAPEPPVEALEPERPERPHENEAPPAPETIAVANVPPEATEASGAPPEVVSPPSRDEGPTAAAETAEEGPRPSVLLDGPSSSEADEVTWIQADPRTQEMTLEEAAARIAEGSLVATKAEEPDEAVPESPPGPAEEGSPTDSTPAMRRPLFRVGEVPIYDEPDFLTELKRELSKCRRVDRPLTLILIRIGDLGQIIELFGKDFREPVLWHIAEQAMESLREVDLVGMMSSKDLIAMTAFASDRYGGGRIVSRMRQAVNRKPFRVGEALPPIIPVLDFGMATFPADGSEVSNLLQRAEEELANGRDQAAPSD